VRDECEVIRQRVEEFVERRENEFSNKLAHGLKNGEDFQVGHRRIAERYLDGEFGVYFCFALNERAGHPADYRAVVHQTIGGVLPEQFIVARQEPESGTGTQCRQAECAMLVEIREFVKMPERVLAECIRRPHLVRLERVDAPITPVGDSGQSALVDSFVVEVTGRAADRVLRSIGGWKPVALDRLVGEVVKSGSHVVEDIPDDRRKMERWLASDVEHKEAIASVRIAFGLNFVRCAVDIGADSLVQQCEVYVGTP